MYFGLKLKAKKYCFLLLTIGRTENPCDTKGNDSNPWFSGITFFAGLALWSLQIKKRSLMGSLFFDADFSTFFHFGR